jgi:hypothetical protein
MVLVSGRRFVILAEINSDALFRSEENVSCLSEYAERGLVEAAK